MYYKNPFHKKQHRSGFSLVEVLVAVSIFSIVVTMSVGTLVVLIDANAKAQNTQTVVNNVAFTLDAMVRDIRTGYHYQCANAAALSLTDNSASKSNCTSPNSAFAFTESGTSLTGVAGGRIGYRLNNGSIERKLRSSGAWLPITAPEVQINTFDFIVTGTSVAASDNSSPLVSIYIEGQAGDVVGVDSSFRLQTTITQQTLDL